jgi:hypothetical protein
MGPSGTGAAVRTPRIRQDGLYLSHLVGVDGYQGVRRALRYHRANLRWQACMAAPFLAGDDHFGTDSALHLAWEVA